MLNNERLPSAIIEDFLELMKRSQEEYAENKKAYESLDAKTVEWAHEFEFAPDKITRNKLGTAYQKERKKRREYKDAAELYGAISEFACSETSKAFLKRLKGALAKQKEREAYLFGQRVYKGKVADANDNDS